MARGKKPANPLMEADDDLLSFLDVIEAYGSGAAVEPDCPLQQVAAIAFARIAEGAVHQHRANLPNGSVGEYTSRAKWLMENALAEACFSSGARWALVQAVSTLVNERDTLTGDIDAHDEEVKRGAARQCALILKDIAAAIDRKGKRGRPPAAKTDGILALWDSMILRDACNSVAPNKTRDRAAIAEQIPKVVRQYLLLGQLPWQGCTEQDSVDIHARRIRRHLDALPRTTRDFRGFSIKRREQ